jgi:hypothetical protein
VGLGRLCGVFVGEDDGKAIGEEPAAAIGLVVHVDVNCVSGRENMSERGMLRLRVGEDATRCVHMFDVKAQIKESQITRLKVCPVNA